MKYINTICVNVFSRKTSDKHCNRRVRRC